MKGFQELHMDGRCGQKTGCPEKQGNEICVMISQLIIAFNINKYL